MNFILVKHLFLTAFIGLVTSFYSVKAQSAIAKQLFNYYELKGLLLKHKPAVESILSMERFKLASSKERIKSIIYAYKRESDSIQVLVRVRKSDGLISEIAWNEKRSTVGNLTHDAIYDGFVPVAGNSRYYNRFRNMALFINYELVNEDNIIPCILRAVE